MKNNRLKRDATLIMAGLTVGVLMAISIKYPVTVEAITEASKQCEGEHLGFKSAKVGLSGKIYHVTCVDEKTFEFK